jgi:hypothetical protein
MVVGVCVSHISLLPSIYIGRGWLILSAEMHGVLSRGVPGQVAWNLLDFFVHIDCCIYHLIDNVQPSESRLLTGNGWIAKPPPENTAPDTWDTCTADTQTTRPDRRNGRNGCSGSAPGCGHGRETRRARTRRCGTGQPRRMGMALRWDGGGGGRSGPVRDRIDWRRGC